MAPPPIAAVVCTRNRADLLSSCLDSLRQQSLSRDLYEVIVVDNGSTDETPKVAARFRDQGFRYIFEKRLGLSHARNRGLEETGSPYVCYIDDDARADSEWLERILDRFTALNPKPVSVGGKILPWYRTRKPKWFKDEYETRTRGERARYFNAIDCRFSGSNMAWQTSVLKALGGFNPRLGMRGSKVVLGEERHVYHKLASILPAETATFYDPSIVVRHLVRRKNMSIGYRLRRQFAVGLALARIRRLENAGHCCVLDEFLTLMRRAKRDMWSLVSAWVREEEPWQRSFMTRGAALALQIGLFVEVAFGSETQCHYVRRKL